MTLIACRIPSPYVWLRLDLPVQGFLGTRWTQMTLGSWS